jgi:hypothetical protein
VLGRISELGLVPSELEAVGADDVPSSLAALGAGSSDAGRHLVAFAPEHAVDALLAGLALGLRLHEQEGFEGRVHAVAPHWSSEARRLLARFSELPFALEPLEAPVLAQSSPVVATSGGPSGSVPLDALVRQSSDPEQRALLARVTEALGGLAAKHGGALRGHGDGIELVALARRMAVLRLDGSGAVLECAIPRRSVIRIERDGVSDALDRVEGALRKHLQERRVREGEEGLRGRVLDVLAGDPALRSLVRWPFGGGERETIDFAALDPEGEPYLGAVRRQLTLESLSAIVRASAALEAFLPLVLAEAEAPVRIAAPRLWLAAVSADASVRHVLSRWTEGLRAFVIEQPGTKQPSLRVADWARPTPAARSTQVEPSPASAPDVTPAEEAPRDEKPPREARPRRTRSSSSRRRSEASKEEEAPATGGGFEEVSLFELDEEASGGGDREARGRRRRRGRGRRGRRSEPREAGATEGGEGEAKAASEEDAASERPARRGGRRRNTSSRTTAEPPPSAEQEDPEEDLTVEDDDGSFVRLSPDAPELDLEAAPVEYDDEEDEAAAGAAAAKETAAREAAAKVAAPPAEPRPPRRRTAIVAHADRDSLAAAVLLARDLRLIEGIWVYPQSELMTFFRSVATDLREDVAVCAIGFAPSPARDVIQAAALYRDRISWFDHHDWPPEDREALGAAIGAESLFHAPGTESSLATVLGVCGRRSRFSDKLVDLAASRFTHHDYDRWGRLWWWRLGEIAGRNGEHRAELEPLLAGRPSDLARAAAKAERPPLPAEAEFAARRDFRIVHFGGYTLAVVPVPAGLDLYLTARIVRERYGARLSLAHPEAGQQELLVLGGEDSGGRRILNLRAMVDHLSEKFSFVEALSDADHVARVRVRGLHEHPQRFDELVGEIAMGRSILEG